MTFKKIFHIYEESKWYHFLFGSMEYQYVYSIGLYILCWWNMIESVN